MIDKKNIAMKNWYKTDCENPENITVKQAYELGFDRAYRLMQTTLRSQIKKTVYQSTNMSWFKDRTVWEVIDNLPSTFRKLNTRVRVLDRAEYQHMVFKLEQNLDFSKSQPMLYQPLFRYFVSNMSVSFVEDDADWDIDVEIVVDTVL